MAADSFGVLLIPVVELPSPMAPTTIVSPLSATDVPKLSPTCVVPTADGFTYACCDHTPALRVNTYTAPEEPAPSLGVVFTPKVELDS
jgi:hypothetical protein